MADKKDALATTDAPAGPLAVPADFAAMIVADRPTGKDEGSLGTEGIGAEDIIFPRIGLAQKMSPELDETKPRYIPGLKFMDLFNSMSKQNYGRGPLHFVILRRYDPRWIEFNPIEEGGGIRDMNVSAGDPRTAFGANGEKPAATMFLDYMVLLLEGLGADPTDNIMALSLKSSGIREAKHLNFLVGTRGEKLICKGVYELTTGHDTDKKSGGTYATYKFKNAGWLKPDSPLEKLAVEMFEAWKDREAKIDDEQTLTPDPTDFNPDDSMRANPDM